MFENLTESEKTILLFLSDGFTSEEIAEKLELSVKTIDHRIVDLRKKTGHNSRIKLISAYFKSLINPTVIQSEIDYLTAKINDLESRANCFRFLRGGKINQLTVINQNQEIENATTNIT